MLENTSRFSRKLRILAHGDYQDAKHLADYVALISRIIFLAALSAIIWKQASSSWKHALYFPLSLFTGILVLHLMKHLYWMTYDYVSSFFEEREGNIRETAILAISIVITMMIIIGVTDIAMEIIQAKLNIGAWITAHDQP